MSLTVTLAVNPPGPVTANTAVPGMVTITNNGANTVSVRSVSVSEAVNSMMGVTFRQPDFLVPNVAPGVFPTIAAGASASYPFAVMSPSPNFAGARPQTPNSAPQPSMPPSNTVMVIQVNVITNDAVAVTNVVGSATLNVPVGAAASFTPVALGGTYQFNGPANLLSLFF